MAEQLDLIGLAGALGHSGRVETATQALHRLTSYEPGREWTEPVDDPRVVQDLEVNDPATFPWPYKRYGPGLPRRGLPRELPRTSVAALDVLAGTARVTSAQVDLPHLSRLLYLSAGVVRTAELSHGRYLFRAAGSAGARFPLEVYVAVPEGGSLPAGVHWYDPLEHALVQVGPAPDGTTPVLIVTGVPWRTGWRYRERGYRHVYWDAGTMLAQLLALADSAGLTARLYTRTAWVSLSQIGLHFLDGFLVALPRAGGEKLDFLDRHIVGRIHRSGCRGILSGLRGVMHVDRALNVGAKR